MSDVVIACLGLSPSQEGEEGCGEGDRSAIELPEVQTRLLQAVAKTGKPVVVVLTGGSAIAANWAQDNVPAILLCWYPGQAGGTAVAEALLGKYNPAGRLPVTFYKSTQDLPPFEDYNMQGHTYRFFKGQPLYPFGYGLSYTKFEYSNLQLPSDVAVGKGLKVSVGVTNVGPVAGDEVAQLYLSHVGASVPTPIRQLAGFDRIRLAPGQKKTVTFTLKPTQARLRRRRRPTLHRTRPDRSLPRRRPARPQHPVKCPDRQVRRYGREAEVIALVNERPYGSRRLERAKGERRNSETVRKSLAATRTAAFRCRREGSAPRQWCWLIQLAYGRWHIPSRRESGCHASALLSFAEACLRRLNTERHASEGRKHGTRPLLFCKTPACFFALKGQQGFGRGAASSP